MFREVDHAVAVRIGSFSTDGIVRGVGGFERLTAEVRVSGRRQNTRETDQPATEREETANRAKRREEHHGGIVSRLEAVGKRVASDEAGSAFCDGAPAGSHE
jgi:hypothetical protein